jgi:hypothetical protein
VRVLRVTELTTKKYAEEEVAVGPVMVPSGSGWNADGMHHVDAHRVEDGKWMACVDGRRAPKI